MALGQAQHTLRGNKYLELYGVVVRWGPLKGTGGCVQFGDILGGLRWPETA